MEYALYNLITNAIKYSRRRNRRSRCAPNTAALTWNSPCSDQGIGMDEKEVKTLPQVLSHRSRGKSGETGTGIGLSIVEQIVTHHGGRIEVTSQPGKGSLSRWWSPHLRRYTKNLAMAPPAGGGRRPLGPDDHHHGLELEGYRWRLSRPRARLWTSSPPASIRIVISDIYIDDRTGLDVLDAARRSESALLRHPDDRARHHGNRDGRHARRRLRLPRQAVRARRPARHP